MSKRCTVCNRTFPDELNYCPQCGAWAETPGAPKPKTSPERASSGEIMLDPLQPDPPSGPNAGQGAVPVGDDIIEIDWEEVETPASSGIKGPPPSTTPAPPQAPPIMAGWQSAPPKKPADAPKPPRSSSADFVLPPAADEDLIHIEPDVPPSQPVRPDEVNIGEASVDDGGSEVRLTPRSGSTHDWEDEPELDQLESAAQASAKRLEEPSAVNLAALAEMGEGDSGRRLAMDHGAREAARPGVIVPAKTRSGGGWLGGGLVGAGLATAACLGLWFAGVEPPASWRGAGNADKPLVQPTDTPKVAPDATAQTTIDQLKAENTSLVEARQKAEAHVAGIQKLLADSKYVTEQQPSAEVGITNLVKDLASAKQANTDAGGAQAELEKVRKENESLASAKQKTDAQLAAVQKLLTESKYVTDQQPNIEAGLKTLVADLATAQKAGAAAGDAKAAIDQLRNENTALVDAKKKAENLVAGVHGLLKEAKYVSDQQPDVVKGIDTLLKDQKKAGEAPATLADAANVLRGAKYVTAEQPSVAKGVEKLLADKQTAEKNFTDASAKLSTIGDAGKDAAAKLQAAEAREKEAATKLKSAEAAVEEMTTKLRSSDASARDATTKLKEANDTLRDVANKLVAAHVVNPDARGQALVRGVEQLVSNASAAPRTVPALRNGTLSRPTEPATPSDPLGAERQYVNGLSNFWAGRYWAAETDFFDAVRAAGTANPDARYYYFLGLTQLAQGKTDEAREMLRMAGILEKERKPPSAVVSRALERVQGRVRGEVEKYRP